MTKLKAVLESEMQATTDGREFADDPNYKMVPRDDYERLLKACLLMIEGLNSVQAVDVSATLLTGGTMLDIVNQNKFVTSQALKQATELICGER